MPCAALCLARFIMLCAVYCALRGLLCPARFTVPCTVYYALRGLFCPARYSALHGLLCFVRFTAPCAAYCALHGLLCPARLIVPCTVYYALRGLLCPARHSALHGLLCRNVHICRGAPHYFYDRQNFLCRQGFSCAERSHRADFARAGARACPCNADTWILSSVRQPWVRQRT